MGWKVMRQLSFGSAGLTLKLMLWIQFVPDNAYEMNEYGFSTSSFWAGETKVSKETLRFHWNKQKHYLKGGKDDRKHAPKTMKSFKVMQRSS